MKYRAKLHPSLNTVVLAAALLVLIVAGSLLHPNFLTAGNIMSILQQMSENGILALGLTLVIITGNIDISIGSIMGLCATVSGLCMASGMNFLLAILISLIVAVACGLLNGLMVAVIKVPAMIATLGTQMLFNGIALGLSEGGSISQLDPNIYFLGQGRIAGIPFQAILLLIAIIVTTILLKKTRLGRKLFAIGNNEKASRYAGIDTVKVVFISLIICAVLCCVAGLIQVGRVSTARADMGAAYLMECISAVVLGGTSIAGGKGTTIGSIAGVLIFTLISNIMNLVEISAFWQQFTTGVVLILVVIFNKISENGKGRKGANALSLQEES